MSPAPHLHPVQRCPHPFHERVTPENTTEKIAAHLAFLPDLKPRDEGIRYRVQKDGEKHYSVSRVDGKTENRYVGTWSAEQIARMFTSASDTGPKHYPPGMGEESRRLHREYNALVEAQRLGAKNGAEVVKLTDECNAKGIILVPGGENL